MKFFGNTPISIKYQIKDRNKRNCYKDRGRWRGCFVYGGLRSVQFHNIGGSEDDTKNINDHLYLTQTRTTIPIDQREKYNVTTFTSLTQEQKEKNITDDVKPSFDSTGNINMSNFNGVNPAPQYNDATINPPENKNGWLTLNKEPGLGLTLSPSAMKKFGTLIYQSKK